MKTTVIKTILLATTLTFCSMAPQISAAQPDQDITMQTFYDQLAPYGQWVNYSPYGNVFIPNAGPGFIPYQTAGHWVYTDQYGWTWDSDYPWGWACFHYGRWNYDPQYGWYWIPDLNWGPAWVVWRNSPQYYGWAPLPYGVDINAGMSNGYGIPADEWCFVPCQYMGDPYIYNYYAPRSYNDIYIRNSAIIVRMGFGAAHFGFFLGPDRVEVARFRPVTPVVISFNADPHHVYGRGEVGFYHPAPVVVRRDAGHPVEAPAHVVNVHDVPQRNMRPAPARPAVGRPAPARPAAGRAAPAGHGDDHH